MPTYEDIDLPANVIVRGNLTVRGALPEYSRTYLLQENLKAYAIPLENLRVFDAYQTLLGSAAADDLGITAGAFGTGCPYLTAGDCKTLGATTRRARVKLTIPLEYVTGETIRINASAGMLTTIADTSCVLDVEVYKSARTTLKSGSDLVQTAATTMNSLTFAEVPFELDPSTLSPGDVLDIRISITCTDAASVGAVTPAIAELELLCDIKG